MAERPITSTEREQRLARNRSWGGRPVTALQRFADEMDRMFDDFGLGRRRGSSFRSKSFGVEDWAPDIDVYQKHDQLVIKADLPGLSKEDVSVEITENVVTIQGERKSEREDEREGFHRSERSYGWFSRQIPLPEGAITDQAKATFRDGVLEITMPAPPATKGRRLEIAGESRK